MTNQKKEKGQGGGSKSWFSWLTIIGCIVIGLLIFTFIMGHPSNFEGGDPNAEPLPGAYLGMAYKGGYIVPILVGMLLMVLTFSIERRIVLSKANGRGNLNSFVARVQKLLARNEINSAIKECDRQKGSVANVMKTTLNLYNELETDTKNTLEQKQTLLRKELEEATVLEMPMLQQNMNIIAALVSLGTLVGLLGTVIGMIRAFNALATSGAPDQTQLANGISEALFNTASGIGTSVAAIISYNIFTARIDKMTFFIDEAGFSIIETFTSNNK